MLAHRTTNPLRVAGLVVAAVGGLIVFAALLPALIAGLTAVPAAVSWTFAAVMATGSVGLIYLGVTVSVGGWAAATRSSDAARVAGVIGAVGLVDALVAFWQDWSFWAPFVGVLVIVVLFASIASASTTAPTPTAALSAPPRPPSPVADPDLEGLVLALADAHGQPTRLQLSEDQWQALRRLRARHGLD
jgi:hypothetical protein